MMVIFSILFLLWLCPYKKAPKWLCIIKAALNAYHWQNRYTYATTPEEGAFTARQAMAWEEKLPKWMQSLPRRH